MAVLAVVLRENKSIDQHYRQTSDWNCNDILAAVRKTGISLSELAQQSDLKPGTLKKGGYMSCTTIIAVWPGKKAECVEELHNASGSGPVIWNDMATHYLGCNEYLYYDRIDDVWLLYKRDDIPVHHRAVLLMTYDGAIVKKENYAESAKFIRAYLSDFPPKNGHEHHWKRIAEIFESDPDFPAIGFWITSVTKNPFSGEWNEETGEYEAVDWSEYWSVFDKLNKKHY
ncbi:helix-turn-helix domain-containing protein [Xenorhabdus sp. XENO-10]|uniref:Helix-turn-helix domain-containing protein n=1 Tax=Xenorhabdus yunnanensis TaxID=3025878 RepID=A0ABT5LJM0_9GAMM|nr:helix-turn-helix domain-containing protein [Xenorhabdus yunnanensis]MDC9590748.1 helix-turn-helix domain-containing protein [Xenorhabdus yunnanensis]